MHTFTCLFPTDDARIRAVVTEAPTAADAVAEAHKAPNLFTDVRTVFVMEGDFRAFEASRNCLREVGYFLAGASHLSQGELTGYVQDTLNQLELIER